MTTIHVKAETGKVNVRFKLLGGKRYRLGITPAYARTLSLELQRAANEAEEEIGQADAEEAPWAALGRWLKGWRGDRG